MTTKWTTHVLSAFLFLTASTSLLAQQPIADMSLDGTWQTGLDRHYTDSSQVPGLAQDPAKVSPGTLWYKRTVQLPTGDWDQAVLTLNGARFAPAVYIDGEKVSSSGGGMAPTVHLLHSSAVAPGKTIQLEIALQSQKDLDPKDASAVPGADLWRTNISSGLWDSVSLHFSRGLHITRIIPFTDFDADSVSVHWQAEGKLAPGETLTAVVMDSHGNTAATSSPLGITSLHGEILVPLHHVIQRWSPSTPSVYKLHLILTAGGKQQDDHVVSWGLKDFHTQDKRFFLNHEPIEMLGGTVVFHRFLRAPGADKVAWNSDWFQKNVLLQLKSRGANTMRWHLGLPPEKFLDLCDQDGLMVQLEWPFFHGVKASEASMKEQWQQWLDVAMRHPSVMIVHGWNETSGSELQTAWAAMNAILADYPRLVVGHRETLHIHKYWWSLFENLGLYYDSADQFDRAIMVDEFGGNYLDLNADPGGYPATKETFLRFLGRDQTAAGRLEFHAESNARVGEYWRRIGAAGVLPFCILGSRQDGSSWFLGDLQNPKLMPVWDALTATFSPQSVSLEVWDRNFSPSQQISLPLYFFNDTNAPAALTAVVQIRSAGLSPQGLTSRSVTAQVPAHGHIKSFIQLTTPATVGDWQFDATLQNKVAGVTHPIVSSWNFRTLVPQVSPALAEATVGIPANEPELLKFLQQNHIHTTSLEDPSAQVLVTSSTTWDHLNAKLLNTLGSAVDRGQSVVLLDVGPRDLGQGYRIGDLGPLDGAPTLKPGEAYLKTQELFSGIKVSFAQLPEPESHIQPGPVDDSLWAHLPHSATWIWNGLRGGLIAPAADMEVSGLSPAGFVAQWAGHGADPALISSGSYFAYQLAGYYAFSVTPDDAATIAALRQRVKFLAEDAPALQDVLNPNAPVEQTDLHKEYRSASAGKAQQLLRLSTCGKNLTRTAIAELTFGPPGGRVILSQALTSGRLVAGPPSNELYGIRHDPAAEQLVLNLLDSVLPARPPAPK